MTENGSKDITLNPPPAAATAEALPPGENTAPEFILYMHEGRPTIYKRYEEESDGC